LYRRGATGDNRPKIKTRLNPAIDIPPPPQPAGIQISYVHAITSTTEAKKL
jgi:hypothetical protein